MGKKIFTILLSLIRICHLKSQVYYAAYQGCYFSTSPDSGSCETGTLIEMQLDFISD